MSPELRRGEWNQELQACGTGLNDTPLRVERRKVCFYESDADVTSATIQNPRAVMLEASFAGEGEVWTDRFEMVLSRSGDQLIDQRRYAPALPIRRLIPVGQGLILYPQLPSGSSRVRRTRRAHSSVVS